MHHKKRTYNVEMISDFIEHLKWELRILLFEHGQKESKINPELTEQLARYIREYNTKGLIAAGITDKNASPEDIAVFKEARTKCCKEALAAIEAATPIFKEAFKCASYPNKFCCMKLNPDGTFSFGFVDEKDALKKLKNDQRKF